MRLELPGLFDLQINGFAGVDFNDPAVGQGEVAEALTSLRATGVTRCLPTLITSPLERFARCCRNLVASAHPVTAGLHMEGPYISADDGPRGAHPREHVRAASVDDFLRRQEAAHGAIKLVTLAPEVPGAIELTEFLVAGGLRVAIGHSAATPPQVRDAIAAGASLSTHLGNGCALRMDRHPNLLWEQLAAEDLLASFIADGHHLSPATFKAMLRAKTPERSILVSDAVAAAGCPPGRYELNGIMVELAPDGRVSPPGQAWLAGSSLTLRQAVANAVRFTGIDLPTAWAMASTRPAGYLALPTAGTVTIEWDAEAGTISEWQLSDSQPA
jgi:N-acetylglucosamine-6-phosphate deacetylase